MKMKQVATRLGKHENTIRKYARQYAEFLSPAPDPGEHRIFTDDDIRVIAFISRLSDSGMQHDEILQSLKRKMDEGSPFPPVLPQPNASEAQALITLPEMEARLAVKDSKIKELEATIAELRRQHTELLEQQNKKEESYIERITRLSEEIGLLRAELKAVQGK